MSRLEIVVKDLPEIQEIVKENIALHDRMWLLDINLLTLQIKLAAIKLTVTEMENSCEPDVCAYASQLLKILERP